MADFIRYELGGVKNTLATLSELPEDVLVAIEGAQKVNSLDLESTAKDMIIHGAKTGRVYKRGSVTHQASAPGEPPASDTGYLVSHIRGFVEERFTAVLAADAAYALPLEVGTRKMGPRPFMDRTGAIVVKRATSRLTNATRKAVKSKARPG